MTVVGISRSTRKPAGFDRIVSRDDLAAAVADLDFLVMLVPYEKETHHIVDARVLAAMKRTAFLVNIARGGVIDEQALIRALENETIAGAALDAYETEPLPKGHPLWTTKNVDRLAAYDRHLGRLYGRLLQADSRRITAASSPASRRR